MHTKNIHSTARTCQIHRRRILGSAALAACVITVMFVTGCAAGGEAMAHNSDMREPKIQEAKFKMPPMHEQRKPEVAMLLYPGVTLLDLLGPQTVLASSCNVHVVWKNTNLLETDSGIVMKATSTFEECPKDLDVLFVPGGEFGIMRDREVLAFLADRGSRAKYVTSVCGGSVVLGAAGLLQGYKATSHWSAREFLSQFGAIPTNGRIVTDRNRVSGGGVTAGIDFGLVLLSNLIGENEAKMTQLALEYDPAPPFDAGTPEKAGPEIMARMVEWLGPMGDTLNNMCAAAARDMGKYTPIAQ